LARTLTSPCLGREPKAKVVIGIVYKQSIANVKRYIENKTSKFLWKISLLGLSDKKCGFACKTFNQTL
jgi:hypothetical protein